MRAAAERIAALVPNLPDELLEEAERQLAVLRVELLEIEKEERKAKGLADPLWFCTYYLPNKFTSPFGPHHRQLADDFVELVRNRTLDPQSRPNIDWREVNVRIDEDGIAAENLDREPGETEEDAAKRLPDVYLSEAEWEALALEEGKTEAIRSVADACPRGHGKTSIYDGLRLWAVVYELTRYMMLGADTLGQAKDYLAGLKNELETNEALREDFGDLVGKKKWTEVNIVTSTGIRVSVFGTRTKIRGSKHMDYRPDLAILDDGENDEFVDTETQRIKTRNWLTKVLIPCLDNRHGAIVVVGTILHHDSLLARLLSKEDFKRWRKRLYKALVWTTKEIVEDGEIVLKRVLQSLWPSRWPIKALLQLRDENRIAFAAEYMNEPMADEASWFPQAGLDAAKERGRGRWFAESYEDAVEACGGRHPLLMFQSWDFGWVSDKEKAENTDSNYTFCISAAVDEATRHIKILRLWRDRGMTPTQTKHHMSSEALRLQLPEDSPTYFRIGVETVGLQKELYHHGVRKTADLPLVPLNTTSRKRHLRDGVPGLTAWFDGGTIEFPWPEGDSSKAKRQRELVQILCNELWGYGKESHDDGVMALWFLLRLVRHGLVRYDRKRKRGDAPRSEAYDVDFEEPRELSDDEKKLELRRLMAELAAVEAERGNA